MKALPLIPLEFIGIELLYFIAVFVLCIIIYTKTREAYQLTKHQGIFHFRNIFLFFALAYLFRIIHLATIFITMRPCHSLLCTGPLTLLFTSYVSMMAIFSLMVAAMSKGIDDIPYYFNYILHATSISLAYIVFITRTHQTLMLIEIVLLLSAIIAVILQTKNIRKIHTQNIFIYLLLASFWIIQILAINKSMFLIHYKIPLYTISLIVFISIYKRVKKRLHFNGKKKR